MSSELSKDDIAELLKTTPEALSAFEESYRINAFTGADPGDPYDMSSKQAAAQREEMSGESLEECMEDTGDLVPRIVDELLARTSIYHYDGEFGETAPMLAEMETMPVTNEEVKALPERLRPDLTGNLARVDINEDAYKMILTTYKWHLDEKDPEKKKYFYHLFRQGLDIQDVDPVTYAMIDTNPNSMGHWFPALVNACKKQEFFQLPKTTIAKLPLTLLQMTRLEYMGLSHTTMAIINEWARKAFRLEPGGDYFVKTGTYSSKFDFRNAHVKGAEVAELGEYLLFIHHQAVLMAGPLTQPSNYGMSTTTEWCVREYIKDKENNPKIYKGLPLHTEYRLFIDLGDEERGPSILGCFPYWDPEVMKKRFGEGADHSIHDRHDYVIYKTHEDTLMERYHKNVGTVVSEFEKTVLPELAASGLAGQWSVDIMQNGNDFWIIDMALAENSAYYGRIPEGKRRPIEENWLPNLGEGAVLLEGKGGKN